MSHGHTLSGRSNWTRGMRTRDLLRKNERVGG